MVAMSISSSKAPIRNVLQLDRSGAAAPRGRASAWPIPVSVLGVLLIIAIASLTACRAGPEGNEPEPATLAPLGQFGGALSAVAASGDRAWLASGNRVLEVDVSDPESPELVAQSEMLPDAPLALATDGQTLVAAVGTSGAAIFDISGHGRPTVARWIRTTWAVKDVALAGDLLYLAEGRLGLRILSLEGAEPETLGNCDTPGDSLAVAVDGNLAFVADWGTGVRIIDVTEPTAPTEIAWFDTPGEAADVAPTADRLAVADRHGGLMLVDVSSPAMPQEVQTIDVGGYAERVATDGDVAYVAAYSAGLVAVDLTGTSVDPVLDRLESATVAVDTVVDGSHVYVADAGAAVAPATNARESTWGQVHMWGIEVKPEVAQGLAGLIIATRSAAGDLDLDGRLPSPSLVESVIVDEEAAVAYLADGYAGLLVMSLEDPASPDLYTVFDTAGASHDCLLDGDRLLVADGPAGLLVFDVAKPRSPALIGSVDTPDEALGIAVSDDLAYVADGYEGLRIIDLAAMQEIAALDTPGYAMDVKAVGAHAFLCDRQRGLRVFDLTEPSAPVETAVMFDGMGDVIDFVLADESAGIAWVAAGPAGLRSIDVSDPGKPAQIATLLFEDSAVGLLLDGELAYVAAGAAGLRVVDIADPSAPREIAAGPVPGLAERLARYKDWIYVAAETGGLHIFGRLPDADG